MSVRSVPGSFPGTCAPVVLVVDDGSTDGTAAAASDAGAMVVKHCGNLGLGEAFRTALRTARRQGFHIMATVDADGQFDPSDLTELMEPVVSGRADLATASRFINPEFMPDMPWIKVWGNRRVARLVSRLSGVHDAGCHVRLQGLRTRRPGEALQLQQVHLHPGGHHRSGFQGAENRRGSRKGSGATSRREIKDRGKPLALRGPLPGGHVLHRPRPPTVEVLRNSRRGPLYPGSVQ